MKVGRGEVPCFLEDECEHGTPSLSANLDDRDPSGQVGDVTFEDTSHKHTYVFLYVCMYVCVCIRER